MNSRSEPDLIRPYVLSQRTPITDAATEEPAAPVIPQRSVPPMVVPELAWRWRQGWNMRQQHTYDFGLRCCVLCGSTDYPHCGYHRAGWNLMRSALVDPGAMLDINP